jgi:hypothetical protein
MLAALVDNVESWANSAANVAQVAAIIVGAIWAYNRFIRQREQWPRATLEQRIQHERLDDRHTLVRVWLKVENVSGVLLRAAVVRTDVYQVLPLTDDMKQSIDDGTLVRDGEFEADWPSLGSLERIDAGEIEPQEGDEFGFDFIVPTEVDTAFVYSYVRNPSKETRELGWSVSSLYDLGAARGEHRERAERIGGHKK